MGVVTSNIPGINTLESLKMIDSDNKKCIGLQQWLFGCETGVWLCSDIVSAPLQLTSLEVVVVTGKTESIGYNY